MIAGVMLLGDMTKETIVNEENEEVRISPEVEQQVIQQWETIGISNDFVFCKIMQDEALLSELIHRILPDLKFKELQVQ